MNPFALVVAAWNFTACVWHLVQCPVEWKMAAVWFCYGVAGSVLAFVK